MSNNSKVEKPQQSFQVPATAPASDKDAMSREQQLYMEDRLRSSQSVDEASGDMMRLETFREETLEWMMEIATKLHLKPITIESAIILFDRLLLTPTWEVSPNDAQLDVLTVVFISIKLYEEYFMTVYDLLDILDVGVKADRIIEREASMIKTLSHRMMSVLPSEHYYCRYLAEPPTNLLLKLLCKTKLRRHRLIHLMEGLYLWTRVSQHHLKQSELSVEQYVRMKMLDVFLNSVQVKDDVSNGKNPSPGIRTAS